MALVDGHIGGLTDGAAGMVQPLGHIAKLHEFVEIFHRGIATAPGGVAHEGRAIDRGQHQIAPADLDVARGVARMLGELRRRGLAQLACQAAGDTHAVAGHIRPGRAPQRQRLGIVGKVHADLFQHRIGVILDDLQRLFGQHLVVGNVAFDVFRCLEGHSRACRPTCRTATTAPASC